MTSKELWEQLVMQRVIETIKVTLPAEEELEEAGEKLREQLNAENAKQFEEFREMQEVQISDNQQLVYERGFLDGLHLAHKAFIC